MRSRAKKKREGSLASFPSKSDRELLESRQAFALRVCRRIRAARWIEANHTGFIGAERALTGRSHRNRNGRSFKRGVRVGCSCRTARTCGRQFIAALDARDGDDRIENASRGR